MLHPTKKKRKIKKRKEKKRRENKMKYDINNLKPITSLCTID